MMTLEVLWLFVCIHDAIQSRRQHKAPPVRGPPKLLFISLKNRGFKREQSHATFFVFLFDLVLKMNVLERMGMSGMINHKESSCVLTPRHETDMFACSAILRYRNMYRAANRAKVQGSLASLKARNKVHLDLA